MTKCQGVIALFPAIAPGGPASGPKCRYLHTSGAAADSLAYGFLSLRGHCIASRRDRCASPAVSAALPAAVTLWRAQGLLTAGALHAERRSHGIFVSQP